MALTSTFHVPHDTNLRVLVVEQVDEVGHGGGLLDHEAARRRVRAHQVKHVHNLRGDWPLGEEIAIGMATVY